MPLLLVESCVARQSTAFCDPRVDALGLVREQARPLELEPRPEGARRPGFKNWPQNIGGAGGLEVAAQRQRQLVGDGYVAWIQFVRAFEKGNCEAVVVRADEVVAQIIKRPGRLKVRQRSRKERRLLRARRADPTPVEPWRTERAVRSPA
jgi:hypothetical protein